MSTGMFSFQGDFKRRTQINLGRTTHENRAALVRRAQEERKAREERRRMELAACKIQVCCYSSRMKGSIDIRRFGEGDRR